MGKNCGADDAAVNMDVDGSPADADSVPASKKQKTVGTALPSQQATAPLTKPDTTADLLTPSQMEVDDEPPTTTPAGAAPATTQASPFLSGASSADHMSSRNCTSSACLKPQASKGLVEESAELNRAGRLGKGQDIISWHRMSSMHSAERNPPYAKAAVCLICKVTVWSHEASRKS